MYCHSSGLPLQPSTLTSDLKHYERAIQANGTEGSLSSNEVEFPLKFQS
jgi:hypothetical protein